MKQITLCLAMLLIAGFLAGCSLGTAYPLHQAVAYGDEGTVRLLIDRGDNVNEQNSAGWTPLMEAAFVGHVGTAKMLLEHGADPTIINRFGETALMFATQQDATLVAQLIEESLQQRKKEKTR